MPEIKLKHVVSFSSEDKVYKAENIITPETYRKWKCATPGEKNATIVLQFEKASQIHSIDIGNESSAFVEVLVGRSSDNLNDFQVLLVASSFMSPLESRNEQHTNRVRMFGPEKLSQNVKDEKWDCVQIVCTQPFNKNISYGLTFVKFHSPSDKTKEESKTSESEHDTVKIGAFKLKLDDDDDDESLLTVGSFFGKQKTSTSENTQSFVNKEAPSYAAAVLALSSNTAVSPKNSTPKRKTDDVKASHEPPVKKSPATPLNKNYIIYRDVLDAKQKEPESMKQPEIKKQIGSKKLDDTNSLQRSKLDQRTPPQSKKLPDASNSPSTTIKPVKRKKKIQFSRIMENVVFVLSGFVNPLRSQLRDKAMEMGAKYKGDWDRTSTHLVCAFLNTPKYLQVRGQDGRVVSKEWIIDCFKKGELLPWRDYKLGKYDRDTTEEDGESTDEEIEDRRKAKKDKQTNGVRTPSKKVQSSDCRNASNETRLQNPVQEDEAASKAESETEDEDAFEDYLADTDLETDSGGGDTEDEIRKIEKEVKKRSRSPAKTESVKDEIPDVSDLPLPELPNLFKQKHFYLFGKFSNLKRHDMQRYITAYNGILEDYMTDKIKYVITESKWDNSFEEALGENEDLIFVKPLWIYKCHEAGKLVPFQSYIVIPDS